MTDGSKPADKGASFALDDLMACLTEDDTPQEPATEDLLGDSASPSPALDAALNAMLCMAEDAVLRKAGAQTPGKEAKTGKIAKPPEPDAENALPPIELPPPAILAPKAPRSDEARRNRPAAEPHVAVQPPKPVPANAMLPRPPSRPMPQSLLTAPIAKPIVVATEPAPMHAAPVAASEPNSTQHLISMLQELSETLDSAETILAHEEIVEPAEVSEIMPPPPSEPVGPGRETLTLAGLVLCLFAGLCGILISQSDWLFGKPPSLAAKATVTTERPGKPVVKQEGLTALANITSPALAAPAAPAKDRLALSVSAQSGPLSETPKAAADAPRHVEAKTLVAATASIAPARPAISAQSKAALLARGKSLLKAGDVTAARLMLVYLARRGDTGAMLALAQSYDPGYLIKLNAPGVRADLDKAISWYQRAAGRGDTPSTP